MASKEEEGEGRRMMWSMEEVERARASWRARRERDSRGSFLGGEG